MPGHVVHDVGRAFDLLLVDLGHNIADVDTGLVGRAVRQDLANPSGARESGLGRLTLLFRLAIHAQLEAIFDVSDRHAQPSVVHAAVANDQLGDPASLADRDGKAIGAARPHVDEGVDADHLTLQVHQGAARVARVDLRISLNVLAHALA